MNVIEPDQFKHIDGKETVKEAWDALKQKHADSHTSLAAFYIKVGMLNKKYTDGESMHAHLSFFSTENCKVATKVFDNEFLAQVMLMSLPRDSTWETLVVALLQSTSDKNPLTTVDVTSQPMQEYHRLTGTDSADTVILASRGNNKSKPSKPSHKRCRYCQNYGHTEGECRRKKQDEEEDVDSSDGNRSQSMAKAKTKALRLTHDTNSDADSDHADAKFASVFAEFPSRSEKWEDDIYVFQVNNFILSVNTSQIQWEFLHIPLHTQYGIELKWEC